jgi:hypothetical protein
MNEENWFILDEIKIAFHDNWSNQRHDHIIFLTAPIYQSRNSSYTYNTNTLNTH